MRNIANNLGTILTNAAIDGLLIDAPITATLSYVLKNKVPSAESLLTSAAIAALAYSIRNIARGRLININQNNPVPLWGAIAGSLKYGLNYYIEYKNDFSTSSFLYTCARGAFNVFLYENSRGQINNIIDNNEASFTEKTTDVGYIFSAFETTDSILSSGKIDLMSIFNGIATGIATTVFVMLSEKIIPNQDKLLLIASSSVLYSLRQDPYDIAGVAVVYMVNKATDSFIDMIYQEQETNLVMAR